MPALLVVVSGPPASGKSTLARELASGLGIAQVSKDLVKETLYDALAGDGPRPERLDEAAFALLLRLADAQLRAGVPFVIESDFDRDSNLDPVLELARRHDVRLVQVHCQRARERLLAHFAERAESGERHPVHDDDASDVPDLGRDLDRGRWAPLELPGELIEIDDDAPDFSSEDVLRRILARAE